MRLVIVRHGEAVMPQVDPDRPLSAHGREQAASIGAQLSAQGLQIPEVWHSSKHRAIQTAELITSLLPGRPAPVQRDGLTPSAPVEPVADSLQHHERDLMLVSHLPFVHDLCACLLDPRGGSAPGFPECGTALLLRDEDGTWSLEQFLLP